MENCCVYNDTPKREKKSQHKFLKRAGFTDEHHLKSRSIGGESLASNLLRMDAYRHDAWHLLFKKRTLEEAINFLIRFYRFKSNVHKNFVQENPTKRSIYRQNAWRLLFKNNSIWEVIEILLRLKIIKDALAQRPKSYEK